MLDAEKGAFLQEYMEEYPAELTRRYELLECLNHKKASETLLAREKDSGRKLVVKCYYSGHPLYGETEPQQLREIRHGGIPAWEGEYRNDRMRCILREYIEGISLWECANGTFSTDFICKTGIGLCGILSYLHGQNPPVVHRDIKPQNVIVKEDGTVALIDFGISRVYKETESRDTLPFGTRSFAPPEQYGFGQTDRRSDIYSLGMLLTWMLTGEARRIETPEKPLEKIVNRCTAFSPKERYDNAEAVAAQLAKLSQDYGKRRRRAACAIGAAALALAVAFLAVWAKQRDGSVRFREPLIEEAVRAELERPHGAITRDDLLDVTELYIHGDRVTTDVEKYYDSAFLWIGEGEVSGEITSIEDLRDMKNLRVVCIGGERITDISALEDLDALEKAEFWYNDITEIEALRGKQHLSEVGLGNNPIEDVSALADCTAIKTLILGGEAAFDGKPLEQLDGLALLDIRCDTDAWKYLSGKTITTLKLGGPNLTELSCVKEMAYVQQLYIYWSEVTDISALEGREDIVYLNMAGCQIDDLSPLLTLPNLRGVVIDPKMREDMETLQREQGGELPFEVEYMG